MVSSKLRSKMMKQEMFMKWREHCERRHKRELEYKQFLEKQKEKQKQKEFDPFDDVRNPRIPVV